MQKTVSKNVVAFTASMEKGVEKPTVVNFIPLSKGEWDKYQNSLTSFEKNKLVSKLDKAGELLYRQCLAADEKGVFIYNAEIDGKEFDELRTKDEAVKFLCGCKNIDFANEVEQAMKGQSTLTEDEVKN